MSKTVKYLLAPTSFGNSTILREHTSLFTKATLVKISKNTSLDGCNAAAYRAMYRCVSYAEADSRWYAAALQPSNQVFLLIFTSVVLLRNEMCSLRMAELLKHVGAN
jgi:hypothetical protein